VISEEMQTNKFHHHGRKKRVSVKNNKISPKQSVQKNQAGQGAAGRGGAGRGQKRYWFLLTLLCPILPRPTLPSSRQPHDEYVQISPQQARDPLQDDHAAAAAAAEAQDGGLGAAAEAAQSARGEPCCNETDTSPHSQDVH